VTTGMDTLADEAGREGFRIRDGPASSKLTHSMEELWEPGRQLHSRWTDYDSSPK
jgi:hypothetical protein